MTLNRKFNTLNATYEQPDEPDGGRNIKMFVMELLTYADIQQNDQYKRAAYDGKQLVLIRQPASPSLNSQHSHDKRIKNPLGMHDRSGVNIGATKEVNTADAAQDGEAKCQRLVKYSSCFIKSLQHQTLL